MFLGKRRLDPNTIFHPHSHVGAFFELFTSFWEIFIFRRVSYVDHSGTIDTYELKQALSNLVDAKNQTLQNMMNDIDKNQSGTIDFDEFIEIMTAKTLEKDTWRFNKGILFIGDDTADKIELK